MKATRTILRSYTRKTDKVEVLLVANHHGDILQNYTVESSENSNPLIPKDDKYTRVVVFDFDKAAQAIAEFRRIVQCFL